MSEVETTIARIKKAKGVIGSFIINSKQEPFRTNFTGQTGEDSTIVSNVHPLTEKAQILIRDLDPSNELAFLRIKTKDRELMVAPDKDFTFICVQETERPLGEDY